MDSEQSLSEGMSSSRRDRAHQKLSRHPQQPGGSGRIWQWRLCCRRVALTRARSHIQPFPSPSTIPFQAISVTNLVTSAPLLADQFALPTVALKPSDAARPSGSECGSARTVTALPKW